jgi:tetratricopeptide (TPR) repeat protein/CHAT domain-containing protein
LHKHFFLIIFSSFLSIFLRAQTYDQLETEYNALLKSQQNDLALIKAKEVYSWVKANESDTSIHLPISLKYIGNAFQLFNKDSSITYYDNALDILIAKKRENHIQVAKVLYNKATVYYNLKNDSVALITDLKAIEVLKKIDFAEYPFCIWSLYRTSHSYYKKFDYKKAETYHLQGLAIQKKVLGEEHPDYAMSLNNLGALYYDMRDYKKAETYDLQALAIRKKVLGEEHADYAMSLNNVGNLYNAMGDYKKAEPYYQQALAIKKKVLGEEHPDYALSLNNLGLLYFDMGDYKKAEPYLLQSLAIERKVLGEEHPDYAMILNNLGFLYSRLGDYKKAETYYLQSLAIKKKVLGEEHPDYAMILNNLGALYSKMGDYKKSEPYHLQALAIRKKVLGEEHPDYAMSVNNLGNLYFQMGDYKKAEPYYQQALAIKKKVLGEEHPDYALGLMNLGLLYSDMGDYKKAEPYLLQALAIRKKVLGEEHSDYAGSLNSLGLIYSDMGDYKKAEPYYQQALAIEKKVFGEEHPDYAGLLKNLGNLYADMGDYTKAEPLILQALTIEKKVLGEEHADYGMSLNNLGVLYKQMGDYKKAEPYLLQAMAIQKKVLGEEHADYGMSLNNLGVLYKQIGDYKKAEPFFTKSFFLNKKLLNNNFSWLTEKQKEAYWEQKKWFYLGLNSYSAKSNFNFSSINSLAFDANLIAKSLLLETSRDLDKAVLETKDEGIKDKFEQLKIDRRLYTKLESEGSGNSELLKKIKTEADSLDKILVNSLDEFRSVKERFNITWQNIQSNLSTEDAAIEFARYYNYSDSSYNYMALILKKGDEYPQLVKLCKEAELKQYSPESELDEMYNLVWKPLLPSLSNTKTIYYTPSGLLNNIPFQALYKEENGQREYVMDTYSMNQLTSTRYLAIDLKQKEQESIEPSIALFGGINYDNYPNAKPDTINHNQSIEAAYLYKNALVLNREIDSTRAGASYLPGTKKEVETIADVLKSNQWEVDVSEGENATENKLKSFSGNKSKSILHIATHGFAFPDKEEGRKEMAFSMMSGNEKYKSYDNPMIRSGLLFGGANITWQCNGDSLLKTTNEDGVLTAYELSQLDLSNTKLAVLSACETGKGAIQGSEGTFGLKRALKLAGVDNMIVSLWKVPDDATMEMMTLFYTELANTKKTVSSFETAQKAMRIKYPNEPKKWAGFVFVR